METFDESTETYERVPAPPTREHLTKARLQAALELVQDVDTGADVLSPDVHIHITTALMALRKALTRYAWIPD